MYSSFTKLWLYIRIFIYLSQYIYIYAQSQILKHKIIIIPESQYKYRAELWPMPTTDKWVFTPHGTNGRSQLNVPLEKNRPLALPSLSNATYQSVKILMWFSLVIKINNKVTIIHKQNNTETVKAKENQTETLCPFYFYCKSSPRWMTKLATITSSNIPEFETVITEA